MRILLVSVLTAAAAFGQPALVPASPVASVLTYGHAVGDLDKTAAFYRDVIGIPATVSRPFPNSALSALINTPGATLRLATFKLPGAAFLWELKEFAGTDRKGAQSRPTDPGATEILIRVQDLEPILTALKKAKAPVVSHAGLPLSLGSEMGNLRAILVRDPDGYLVEVVQTPANPLKPTRSNILGAAIVLSAGDMDATLSFYRDLLGFAFDGKHDFSSYKPMLDLVGAPAGSQFREMGGKIPGSGGDTQWREFKGMPRTPSTLRAVDPGASGLSLRVTNLDALVVRLKAAHVKVISTNGEVVPLTPAIRGIFIEDPNGLKIELSEVTP